MKGSGAGRRWAVAALLLVCAVAVAFWQRQALARLAVIGFVEAFAHERLAFDEAQIGSSRAVFRGLRVTSFRGEPVATVAQLDISYDVRDLLPGGRRMFGLKTVEADSPQVTIIRRPDGSFNVPIPNLNGAQTHGGAPLIVTARVRDGSLEVVDESPYALPQSRSLYAENVSADADISAAAHSTYRVTLDYGERPDELYPVGGSGAIDTVRGDDDQHWVAARLPIAGAVNFVVNAPSLRLHSGMLQNVDARYFAIGGTSHLAASAALRDGSISVAGLAKPIVGVAGPIDAYDDGILTPGLTASLAGIPAAIAGGIYDLSSPRLRVTVAGNADLAQLRGVFLQAQRLPMRGALGFSLLVEGDAKQPLMWIALHSPHATYAGTTLQNLDGVVAFDGHAADVIRFDGSYGRVKLVARGTLASFDSAHCVRSAQDDTVVGSFDSAHCVRSAQDDTVVGSFDSAHCVRSAQDDTVVGSFDSAHCVRSAQDDTVVGSFDSAHCVRSAQDDTVAGSFDSAHCVRSAQDDTVVGSFDSAHCVRSAQDDMPIAMLVSAEAPAGGAPYASALLPQVPLHATVLATANDPRAFAMRGALWGAGGSQALDAIFNVDARGDGSIGPLVARSGRGSLYARIALDRTHRSSVGLVTARDLPLPSAKGALSATLAGGRARAASPSGEARA